MGIEIDKIVTANLFPNVSIIPTITLEDLIKPKTDPTGMFSVLLNKYSYSWNNTYNPAGKLNGIDYRQYLQIGNIQIKNLVNTIIKLGDTNDKKADKILNWVQNNISYVSDEEQYHRSEYWAKPTETLKSMKGDCEDQAFLIQSMAIAAGISPSRLRTYGGLVKSNNMTLLGGHAWTIYKRESDNQWVDLDSTYYSDNTTITSKETFKSQNKYVDAYWWMNAFGTYDEYGKWGIDIYA